MIAKRDIPKGAMKLIHERRLKKMEKKKRMAAEWRKYLPKGE